MQHNGFAYGWCEQPNGDVTVRKALLFILACLLIVDYSSLLSQIPLEALPLGVILTMSSRSISRKKLYETAYLKNAYSVHSL